LEQVKFTLHMTRSLYTGAMKDSSLHEQDAEQPDSNAVKRALRSFKLNIWLAVTTAVYGATLFGIRLHPDWSPWLKITLALTPILPGLFYLRNGLQLLRGLDELQRRIQLEAWLFAALGTVVVGTIINVVNAHGLGGDRLPHGLEVGGTYLTMFMLWCVGVTIANCRYR
jgi:hypothetical protein